MTYGQSFYNSSQLELMTLLTICTFGVFSRTFTPAGIIIGITLHETIQCFDFATILTGYIQIRNAEFIFGWVSEKKLMFGITYNNGRDQNPRIGTRPSLGVISKKRISFFGILTTTLSFYGDSIFYFPMNIIFFTPITYHAFLTK